MFTGKIDKVKMYDFDIREILRQDEMFVTRWAYTVWNGTRVEFIHVF